MNGIYVTHPTLDDIPSLWKWGEENWQLWGDDINKWFSKKSLKRWLKEPKGDVLLVARDKNKLIGMCMTVTIRNWAFCVGLFVEHKYRNRGIGKKLLDKTRQLLKKKRVESLILLVDTKNTRAIKFYQREKFYQGFKFFMMTKNI